MVYLSGVAGRTGGSGGYGGSCGPFDCFMFFRKRHGSEVGDEWVWGSVESLGLFSVFMLSRKRHGYACVAE